MNNEVIRTMVKLLLNKDTGVPVNISEGTIKSENKKMLEAEKSGGNGFSIGNGFNMCYGNTGAGCGKTEQEIGFYL